MENSPLLLVLTGKTASGKDTIMSKLLNQLPNVKRVVTTTSRTPRAGEKNEVDYYFVSEDDFKKKIESKDFIEYVSYGGNFYGTQKVHITNNLQSNLIWRIDPSRAGQIKDFIKAAFDSKLAEQLLKRVKVIYLTVDDATVINRLQHRGLTEQEINTRMEEDARFWQQYQGSYDDVVENIPGQLEETVNKVLNIIK